MDQITAVIQGTEIKTFNRKDGTGQFQVFEVNLNGEKYRTTENHFRYAQVNPGAQVIASITVEQNGQYTNKSITNLGPLTPHGSGIQMPQSVVAQQPSFIPQPEFHPDAKQGMIHRQTAAKVAAHTSKSSEEFWGNVDDLVHYFDTGVKPGSVAAGAMQAQTQQIAQQVAQSLGTPQAVQASFNGGYNSPAYNTADSDVPF